MQNKYTPRIMSIIARQDYRPLKIRALCHALNIPDDEYQDFRQSVQELSKLGDIVITAAKTISLPQMPAQLVGSFQATRKGFGFVRPDKPNAHGDLYIPSGQSLDAITGDRVQAKSFKKGKRDGQTRYTGKITKVLNRSNTQFVGTLFQQDKRWFIRPEGNSSMDIISVDDPGAKNAKAGDKVQVEILSFPTSQYYAESVIIEVLGKSGTDRAELKAVIRRFKLEDKFPRPALNDTRQSISDFDPEQAIAQGSRQDIRDKTIITIDPADARDYDDAISLKKLPQGHWQLGVHIADVSHFVRLDTHLDDHARKRATSVYLPGHVVPMLPELLSNGVCSLQADQDRFAKSVYIKLDQRGKVLDTHFANSVIRSTQRLTYEDADIIMAGKNHQKIGTYNPRAVKLVEKMKELARVIHKRRQNQGMLSLDLPKADLVFNEKGKVVDVKPESSTFSHTMIEMFMLEANEAVARLLDSLTVPFLRRVHPEPNSLSTGDMARTLKMCGHIIPKTINRKGTQQLLASVKGKPESYMINLAILKSLQKAVYSPSTIGHYALASTHYCHFTSPIRRYPDLSVHRLLQGYLQGKLTKNNTGNFPDFETLETLGTHCSDKERNAESAENDLRDLKILQLLNMNLGQNTKGVVTSITNFGLFVQLEKYLTDGLISSHDALAFKHSASKHKGRRKPTPTHARAPRVKFTENCPFKLGQEIDVRIIDVNLPARTIDLLPIRL